MSDGGKREYAVSVTAKITKDVYVMATSAADAKRRVIAGEGIGSLEHIGEHTCQG